jgi:transposase
LLSREELLTLVADQAALIEQLRAEIVELRRRSDQNSSNSSRPPSSDSPYDKPRPKSSGMPAGDGPRRKPGKQRGAAGKNRRQVRDPDETIPVEPQSCTGCGTGLTDAPVLRVFKRQVFEASPPPPRVIQFDVAQRQCPCCGTVNEGKAPAWASARVQWGPVYASARSWRAMSS